MKKIFTSCVLSMLVVFTQAQLPQLWGMAPSGGTGGLGTIFSLKSNDSNFTVHYDFSYNNLLAGAQYTQLCQASNGKLYGMTEGGGTKGFGVLFSYDTATATLATLVNFTGVSDSFPGEYPYGSLVQASNGLLYGMTTIGGANNDGVLFSYDPVGGGYHDLVDFDGNNNYPGANPYGSLIQATNGLLYGMTSSGGANSDGDIFSYDPVGGGYHDLIDFDGNINHPGASPFGSLLQASNGLLYGMTNVAGANGDGNIFSYNPVGGGFNDLIDFDGNNNYPGANPYGSLMQASNGLLYGLTIDGGANSAGNIFSYDPVGGGYHDLIDFDGDNNYPGQYPFGTLVQASNGSLYGMAWFGGANGGGDIFSYNPAGGGFSDLVDFDYTNGANPFGSLMQASNGLLYGMTNEGGAGVGAGVLFSFDAVNNAYAVLVDFFFNVGTNPNGSLELANNGKLYGMSEYGGANGYGVLFSIDPASNTYTKLLDFSGMSGSAPGANPTGSLVQASNGKLYGMTSAGGANNYGVMFSYDPVSAIYTDLLDFGGVTVDGQTPYGSMVQASNGLLYGMSHGGGTGGGGPGNLGVVFSCDTLGNNYTDVFVFNGYTGEYPYGNLVQASNSKLYGMTYDGGANFGVGNIRGHIFSIDMLGNYSDVYDFKGTNLPPDYGEGPYGSLIQASNGKLYGMTSIGGQYGAGNIFSCDLLGNAADLFDFGNVAGSGENPKGSLVQASDGNLYGMANAGGANGDGVIFQYNIGTSTYTDLRDLNTNDGISPAYNSFIEVPGPTTNTWLGGTNDWNTATNWSFGTVPACTDIKDSIPVTGTDPVISIAENASNLAIDDGVTLTVNAALSVCGNLTGGASTAATIQGTTALTLTGTALQTLSGLIAFQSQLALDNTSGGGTQVQLASGAAIDIYNAVVLENNNTLDASLGTLTLKSTSVTQAAIIDNFSAGNNGTVTGSITAERYYGAPTASNDFSQHMLGSPVGGINLSAMGSTSPSSAYYEAATGGIHNCNELLGETGTPYGKVFSYVESHASSCVQNGWLVDASSTAVSAGMGYSVVLGNGSGTLSLTGTANLATSYNPSTTNSGYANTTSDQGRSYPSGINLVSNPYSATLNVSSLNTANSTNFSGQTVYVWNVTNGSYDMNPATIAPFQAFMVIQSVAGSSSYTISGTSRTTTAGSFQRTANPIELNMTVTNNSTGLTDNTVVGFNPNSIAQFDPAYDVIKLPGALTRHTIYTLNSNYWLAVNVLKSINETSTVPVGFEPGVSGTYTANFNGLNSFDPTSYVMLEDLQTGTMFNVRIGDYTFTSDATNDSWNRFVLHFTPPASISTINATCSEQGMINITQPGTAIWNYTLADNNNVSLFAGALNSASPVSFSVPAGVYTLTLVDNNGYTVVKTVEVNGVQPVVASFTTSANAVNVNQGVTLSSTSTSAALNSWDFGDGTTDNGATVSHAYTSEGVYNITLNSTSASGCNSSASSAITVTRSVTGVTDLNDINHILIWSNEDVVNVDFTRLNDVQANIEIYNILGQKLSEDKYVASTVYRKEIPYIEEGYIVVSVRNNDEIITQKLFISNVK